MKITLIVLVVAGHLGLSGCDTTEPVVVSCEALSWTQSDQVRSSSGEWEVVWSAGFSKCDLHRTAVLSGEYRSSATFTKAWVRGRVGEEKQYSHEAAGDWESFDFVFELSTVPDGQWITTSVALKSQAGSARVQNIRVRVD